jgi:hypothetical protein
VPTLPSGMTYHVVYLNGPTGGNVRDSRLLAYWRSFDIGSYAAGGNLHGGSFDLSDVVLLAPPHDSSVPIPTTFDWSGRGVANDIYTWEIATTYGVGLCTDTRPAGTSSFTLDGATGGQCGLYFGLPYRWSVYVADGDGSRGYGLSGYYRLVTLLAGAGLPQGRLGGESPPAAVTERSMVDLYLPLSRPYSAP